MMDHGIYAGKCGKWSLEGRDRSWKVVGIKFWEVSMRLKNYWSVDTRESELERQEVVVSDVK